MKSALILGGGGPAAEGWECGLIAGLAEAGIDVRGAGLLVGTSAGARVAVQIASGMPAEGMFRRQLEPPPTLGERARAVDWMAWRRDIARAKEEGGGTAAILRRIGAMGLEADAGPNRRDIVASQLPMHSWPERPIRITAVEAETGERRVFDRDSGIDLVDAVAASGSVIRLRPPVAFRGKHYIDGGFYSSENADLAAGCGRVLIFALRSAIHSLSVVKPDEALSSLRAGGSAVEVIHPGPAMEAALKAVGGNLMSPAVRAPAARAGHDQGRQLAGRILEFWG